MNLNIEAEGRERAKITVRRATPADKPRILAISEQIWEGDDYIPRVIDDWLAESNGEFTVAELDGLLVAYGHAFQPRPGYLWLEGLRGDPAYRGLGAAKALMKYSLERARELGVEHIGLSTYIDNKASIHIIEASGFRRMAEFTYLGREVSDPRPAGAPISEKVSEGEALRFISRSRSLALSNGFLSRGWRVFPFSLDPEGTVKQVDYRIGTHRDGKLIALLCASSGHEGPCVDFLEGPPEEMRALLQSLLAPLPSGSWPSAIVVAVPPDEPANPALAIFQEAGFQSEHQFEADLFVYEWEA